MKFNLLHGDSLAMLQSLPSEHFHVSISSPPYYGLRDYGVEGQIGLEATLAEFIDRLVMVYREVRRVLRSDGLCWVNIADCYSQNVNKRKADDRNVRRTDIKGYSTKAFARVEGWERAANTAQGTSLAPKQLIMQSFELAKALQNDGWWVRSDIIWSKPNPMPSGTDDRPALDYEHIFMISKSPRYYYNQWGWRKQSGAKAKTTWRIPIYSTKKHSHNASFPPELVRRCLLLSTSDHGVCAKCGRQWKREVEPTDEYAKQLGRSWNDHIDDLSRGHRGAPRGVLNTHHLRDWAADCECNADVLPARVLDPFSGSGTTGVAALSLGRHYTGIELNPTYLQESRLRLESVVTGVPVKEMEAGQLSIFEDIL